MRQKFLNHIDPAPLSQAGYPLDYKLDKILYLMIKYLGEKL